MSDPIGPRDTAPPSVLSLTLPAESNSARAARQAIRQRLEGQVAPDALDTVLLLATELVSNAAACAPTPLQVRVLQPQGGTLRVEVADRRPGAPRPAAASTDAESGRGLRLVDGLAESWGAVPLGEDGKVMWFTVQA